MRGRGLSCEESFTRIILGGGGVAEEDGDERRAD